MIKNDEQLKDVAARVGRDIQSIQDYLAGSNNHEAKIRFPRGYLRAASHFRKDFHFLSDETLKRNIAYTLILSDVFQWLLNRTDIFGTAKEMIIKEGICLVGSVCESTTKDVLQKTIGQKKGYKVRTKYLVDRAIIDPELKSELDWVWDTRNKEHLFLLQEREHEHYKVSDYNRAIRALRQLRVQLDKHYICEFQ